LSLLDLDGKDLDREIQKIIKSTASKRKPWTEKEIEIVRKLRDNNVPYKDIAKALGRTVPSVSALISQSEYY
jgi:DNA-binding CsgD family transcriptional regulator